MKSILGQLSAHVSAALVAAIGEEGRGVDPLVRAAGDPKFGDYQSNVAMGLAKRIGKKPRDLAQAVCDALVEGKTDAAGGPAFSEMCDAPEIAGPGFINLRLKEAFVRSSLGDVPAAPGDAAQDRLGIEPMGETSRDTVVIDYSSPNVAKQMHVGHLRSTIIGDTIARVLEFEGHAVHRQNHVGDWGTQFGIILEELFERGILPREIHEGDKFDSEKMPHDPGELENLYRAGNAKMTETAFAERARAAVGRLQQGNETEGQAWKWVVSESLQGVVHLYKRLGVSLSGEHTRGESFYNPLLAGVGEELRAAMGEGASQTGTLRAACREDNGALCVFLEDEAGEPAFKNQDGDPLPMIIQKSDGAYLYSTTDLAAAAYRINDASEQPIAFKTKALPESLQALTDTHGMGDCGGLGGSRLLYVVGSPQKLHFQMLFSAVAALGWTMPGGRTVPVRMEHVAFGSVLGADRKMLKTRSGENVKLKDLLDEAVSRAEALVRETEADPDRRRGFSEDEIKNIAETVGIGAVKYADLAQNRNTDYVFAWDKMLALQGNTAPYMLYAYARIRSIYRKGEEAGGVGSGDACGEIQVSHPAERALGLRILQLAEVLDSIAESLLPNVLCDYLYDLAGKFMTFYEACPVLQAPDESSRASRLKLCELTARSLRLGLGLLGIKTLERM